MNLVTLLLALGTFQGIFLGIILVSVQNGKRGATNLFAIIIFSLALTVGEEFIEISGLRSSYPHSSRSSDAFLLLIGPALYLYTLLITGKKKRLRALDFLHLLPFLIYILLLLPFYLQEGAAKLANHYPGFSSEVAILGYSKAIHFLLYWYLTVKHLVDFRKSDEWRIFPHNNYLNILWVQRILLFLSLWGLISIIFFTIENMGIQLNLHYIDSDRISGLLATFLFYFAAFILIKNPLILPNVIHYERLLEFWQKQKSDSPTQYRTSPLNGEQKEQILKNLMACMEREKPYLNPELNPQLLGELTGTNPHYISQVTNEILQKNFFEFINAYRVEEVKSKLLDPQEQHKTILAIALESGFNSKSSFNRIFKSYTGLTPTQFKKSTV